MLLDTLTVAHVAAVAIPSVGTTLVALLLSRYNQRLVAEDRKHEEEMLARRIELAREDEARRKEDVQRQLAEAESARHRLSQAVDRVTSSVTFVDTRIQVGTVKTGERAVGMSVVDSPEPADDVDFRSISSPADVGSLLPSELAYGDMIAQRIATGDARVLAHLSHVPVTEAVYEPLWEVRKNALYVLIDVSPSMFKHEYGGDWKRPIYWNVLSALATTAVKRGSTFILRPFDGDVKWPVTRISAEEELQEFLLHPDLPSGSYTDIQKAIFQAIEDLEVEAFDHASIVIITDGDDEEKFDVLAVRTALKAAGVRLHSVLLGVDNKKLQLASDLAQTILPDFTLGPERRLQ
jgi:hypothetical protein